MGKIKTGSELIAEERQRQLNQEGWTPEHDDEHTDGELALVAALYATPIPLFARKEQGDGEVLFQDPWPWWDEIEQTRYSSDTYFYKVKAWDKRKKHSKLRKLVIAGALIAAEIDRLQRIKNRHFIHHEVVPGIGWVAPNHPLHPDNQKSSPTNGEGE